MSVFDNLLNQLPNGTQLPLKANPDPALSIPKLNSPFIRPPLRVEEANNGTNVPIIIVTAPGAVGKSALAQYIAEQKQCPLWELAKLTLGTNTFQGTLARSYDLKLLPQVVDDLGAGKILFILDAVDEVEIISGWQRVEDFLNEIVDFVYQAPNPCIVLFARSETAGYMSIALTEAAQKRGLPDLHTVYSIEYFVENQAKEFIEAQLGRIGNMSYKTYYSAFSKVVDQLFSFFIDAVRGNTDAANITWSNPHVRSFLG